MTQEQETSWLRLLPPHVLLAAILSSWALDRWWPLARLWGSPSEYVGGTIVVVALAVNIYCALQFYRRQTTVIPFRESTALITDGLYRYTRNPIYLSMVVVLIGFAVAWGSLTPWLVPPAFMAIMTTLFICYEELMLEKTFGVAYRKYCASVRRWL